MRLPLAFHNNLLMGKIPIIYCVIGTHFIQRIYSTRELSGVFSAIGFIADGSVKADGSEIAGAQAVGGGEKSGRVVDFGSFSRTVETTSADIFSSFSLKQQQHISVTMDNTDYYFTKMLAKEPLLSMKMSLFIGFEEHSQGDHFQIFSGVISEISIDKSTIAFEVEEG